MNLFTHPNFDHQDVHFFHDRDTGMRCIIAIHQVIAGITGGGCRFFPYDSVQDALTDVLLLSRAMTFKNVLAGLPMGGGKAVVIGDPDKDKTPEIMRAFARYVDSLAGRYVTACDVGTNEDDMLVVRGVTRHAMGAKGKGGSTSPLTGYGVYHAMRAAWELYAHSETLDNVRVAVQGFGGVGTYLVRHLVEAGAQVWVADPRADARQRASTAGATVVPVEDILFLDVDILAPCAMGGVLNDDTVDRIKARVICGGANNQVVHADIADTLMHRGVTLVPDFVASSGGIIHGEGHYRGRSESEILARAGKIYDTTKEVLEHARSHQQTPLASAQALVGRRLQSGATQK
jgi:valine dehydrogenase (NAD+)